MDSDLTTVVVNTVTLRVSDTRTSGVSPHYNYRDKMPTFPTPKSSNPSNGFQCNGRQEGIK